MIRILRILVLTVAIGLCAVAHAQLTLVKGGKAKAAIVLADDNATNREAAELLNFFIQKTSGASLPIVQGKPSRGAVVIGEPATEAGYEGFMLHCHDGNLHIQSGGGRGAIYGVATLLEQWLGVAYYAYEAYTVTPSSTLQVPAIRHAETPAFRFRQTFSYGCEDPRYVRWFRLNRHDEVFAGNLWVHTFNRILPAAVYHGGEASQGLHAVGDGDTGMGVAIVNGHDFHRKNPFQAAQRLLFSYHTTTRWQVAIFP